MGDAPVAPFEGLDIDVFYEGRGDVIASTFVVPVLLRSARYDRLTSYFSAASLVATAEGVESLWRRQGRMRLLVGIHDLPRDIAHASTDAEWVEKLILRARRDVIEQCSRLTDELERNRIGTLGMMLRDGFLEVRIGAPRRRRGIDEEGILHNKRLLFYDAGGNAVVAVGSPNETGAALTANTEELSVDTSWESPRRTQRLIESFEVLWSDRSPDIAVRPLDPEFADELLRAVGPASRPGPAPVRPLLSDNRVEQVLAVMRQSPEFAFANVARAALFAHQERALRDAASRTPIRVLLADEVGLGKTLEAGSVIAYALRHRGVRRVLILAPAGLLKQWQDELWDHFEIDAHRYDGSLGGFIGRSGTAKAAGGKTVLDRAPGVVLVSWHLARGTWRNRKVLEKSTWQPNLVVVDEAHAARRRREEDGSFHATQVWHLVQEIGARVANLILVTATPMQLQVEEYHGLLMLLGLPRWWEEPDNMIRLLEHLGHSRGGYELDVLKMLGDAVGSSVSMYDWGRMVTDQAESVLVASIAGGVPLSGQRVVGLMGKGPELDALAVRLTPPAMLTVRNTRGALARIGYRFPRREFRAPPLDLNEPGRRFLRRIDDYLSMVQGKVEETLGLVEAGALGFVRSVYYQRFVSSLASAGRTLARRRDRLSVFVETGTLDEHQFMALDGDESPDEELEVGRLRIDRLEQARQEARIELQYLDEMLEDVRSATAQGDDPKLITLEAIIAECLGEGDAVLVFSRFTDTVDACVGKLQPRLRGAGLGFGSYTGDGAWVERNGSRQKVDKATLRRALRDREVQVVFCSEAASEGLNLQAARVLVNVDVPWNPARLEQRIGRIARLGQRAAVVVIHNLWYPETIESRMYERLLERQDLYALAVGEFPDVIGAEIRSQLRTGAMTAPNIESVLAQQRGRLEAEALNRIWSIRGVDRSVGTEFRASLFDLLVEVARRDGALLAYDGAAGEAQVLSDGVPVDLILEAGEPESLSLRHRAVGLIGTARLEAAEFLQDVEVLVDGSMPIALVTRTKEHLRLLGPRETMALVRAVVLGGRPPDFTDAPILSRNATREEVLVALRGAFPNRIEPSETLVPGPVVTRAGESEVDRSEVRFVALTQLRSR